jgi:hypothetical protein
MEAATTIFPGPEPAELDASVFLNCPFDDRYKPLLNSIILTVLACGFIPRISTESGSVSEPRLERICRSLHGSRFSIHDLSRCQGEGDLNLARFNMPLELGIAMGRRYATMEATASAHDWFVMVPEGHPHTPYISDLAGFDPGVHEETPESLVPAIMGWLLTREDTPGVSSKIEPPFVIKRLPKFNAAVERLTVRWYGKPPWKAILDEARRILPSP